MVRTAEGILPDTRAPLTSAELRVVGIVQGVGFRPFVARLAKRYALAGSVCNTGDAVMITIAGSPSAVEAFGNALTIEAPPLARIDRVELAGGRGPAARLDGFRIAESSDVAIEPPTLPPDAPVCGRCLEEMADPANRRYRYPFITCTDCGPRYSLAVRPPFDRARTSMRRFRMCPACAAEYATPGDRRCHSQTNSCPTCGPRLWLESSGRIDETAEGDDAIGAAAAVLRQGGIVAVRGVGGFHLAADATDAKAVELLRARKRRTEKPFAVMVRSLEEARAIAFVDEQDAALLADLTRPVVLLRRRADAGIPPEVAPGLDSVGVLLAYAPLHFLLLEAVGTPLVMTSGNRSDEPLIRGNRRARRRLAGVADAFLLHDRPIVAAIDDSVVRAARGGPIILRRARGFPSGGVTLPVPSPRPLLAVGADLKNTFSVVQEGHVFTSSHIGDLHEEATVARWRSLLARAERVHRIAPEFVTHDLHPSYRSTALAHELGLPLMPVQHHHAHIAAVLAEHGESGPVIGLAFDGTGYGADGRVWGAEVLRATLTGFQRVGHLRYAPMPGGDIASRSPWRAALGYASLEPGSEPAFALAWRRVAERERLVASRQIAGDVNAPLASSMGRLFDAAAAVLGVRWTSSYEGQAAIELEQLAAAIPAEPLPFGWSGGNGGTVLDPVRLLVALGERRQRGGDVGFLSAMFHESVAAAAAEAAERAAGSEGLRTVVLAGGSFQNARLLHSTTARLAASGLRVLRAERFGPNDGAISVGQAAIAAARLAANLL